VAHLAELTGYLDVFNCKNTNYEQCERDLAQKLGARQGVTA
jgi:hypothetical protein